ncbi:MAG: SCO family protein [Schleiferiaceae bacterium]
MSKILSLFSAVIFLVACSHAPANKPQLPFFNTPDFTPHFYESFDVAYAETIHTLPDFQFTDDHGGTFTQDSLLGKIHVASFIFTQCGSICPTMVENMKALEPEFSNSDFRLVSYSVTPWIDTKEILHSYRNDRGIPSDQWKLITGNTSEIYDLARKGYFAEEDLGFTKDSTDFLHTEHLLLVDQTLRIRGIYNGTLPLEIEQLSQDIQALRLEDL